MEFGKARRAWVVRGIVSAFVASVIAGAATLQVSVAQRKTNSAPLVDITSPGKGAVFSGPLDLTIAASASDSDGTVALVEFYKGTTKLGQDATAPYSFLWTNVSPGSYSLTARAIDNLGADKKSKPVSITVNADPRTSTGEWSSIISWPDVAIHVTLLPNGHVLTWADDDHDSYPDVRGPNKTKAYVVTNPDAGALSAIDIPNESTNLFCSGHAYLADGRILAMGGHEGLDGDGSIDTNIFDYTKNAVGSWEKSGDMASGRWYPTACTLANGDVLTLAGIGPGTPEVPEVWSNGVWRKLTTAGQVIPYYPFTHLAPNGKVFVAGPAFQTQYLDTAGTGAWTFVANLNVGNRSYGSSVMYEPGKVFVVGGADPPTNAAEVINLLGATPQWRLVASMAYARRQQNATLLPDGTVLVTGGTSAPGFNNSAGSVFAAELWNPVTERWSTMASMQVRRLYHSTAILLPDGRVLSSGGGRPWADGEPYGTEHRDAEIYSPPYLFKGARPTLEFAPAQVGYGETFFVGTPDTSQISKVTWVRLSSATHALNMNQRFNTLSFTATTGGLNVTAPVRPADCPPGHYLMFILNGSGIPSVARVVRIG
jgi:hypothetical protein